MLLISSFQYNYRFRSLFLILMMKHSVFLIYTISFMCDVYCYMLCVMYYCFFVHVGCVLLTCLVFNHISRFWICEMECVCVCVCMCVFNIPQCSTLILPVSVILCSPNINKFASYMPGLTKCYSGVSNTPELYSGAFMFTFKGGV